MNEAQYYSIARACDRVLRRPGINPARVANPLLHVVSEHEVHMAGHMPLLNIDSDGQASSEPGASVWGKTSRLFGRAGGLIKKTAQARIAARRTKGFDGESADVVIRSWLVNPAHVDKEDDFYFGDIQSHLADMGLSSIMVWGNLSGRPFHELMQAAERRGMKKRVLLPDAADLSAEYYLFSNAGLERKRLIRDAESAVDPLEKNICLLASRRGLMMRIMKNLRMYLQVEELCRDLKPWLGICLYEGHPWERLFCHAVRQADPNAICAGYQHTILRRHAFAARRRIGMDAGFDPDTILTMGDVTREEFENTEGLNGTAFLTYGTHRRPGGEGIASEPRKDPVVLVLPEGLDAESINLFNFALACAKAMPDVRFVFRCHPVLPFDRLKDRLTGYDPPPANVEISDRPAIEADFDRAGYLLYRGSSTVIYGILSGLKPFYLVRQGEMDIDPIYGLEGWRERTKSVEGLKTAIDSDRTLGDAERTELWKKAGDYCRSYAQPVDTGALEALVDAARARQAKN